MFTFSSGSLYSTVHYYESGGASRDKTSRSAFPSYVFMMGSFPEPGAHQSSEAGWLPLLHTNSQDYGLHHLLHGCQVSILASSCLCVGGTFLMAPSSQLQKTFFPQRSSWLWWRELEMKEIYFCLGDESIGISIISATNILQSFSVCLFYSKEDADQVKQTKTISG